MQTIERAVNNEIVSDELGNSIPYSAPVVAKKDPSLVACTVEFDTTEKTLRSQYQTRKGCLVYRRSTQKQGLAKLSYQPLSPP